jgi:hypothetical protein
MAEVTRQGFAKRVLNALDMKAEWRREAALLAWMQAEGGDAKNNPLNTTQRMKGSSDYNSVHVQNYPDLETGVTATVKTLRSSGHGYEYIIDRLEHGTPREILQAVAASSWGTGALALEVLPDVKADFDKYAAKPISQ